MTLLLAPRHPLNRFRLWDTPCSYLHGLSYSLSWHDGLAPRRGKRRAGTRAFARGIVHVWILMPIRFFLHFSANLWRRGLAQLIIVVTWSALLQLVTPAILIRD